MKIVSVRVPIQQGMTGNDVLVAAVQVYLQCSHTHATEIIAERGFRASRELNQQESTLSELTVRLSLPEDMIDDQRESTQANIDGLSSELREFIFQGGQGPAELTPDLIDDYNRIIDLSGQMSEPERSAYLEQTSVDTTDPVEMARALEQYAQQLQARTSAMDVRIEAERRIFGVEGSTGDIRRRMREIREELIHHESGVRERELSLELSRLNQQYDEILQRLDFDSREELEAAMEAFTNAYRHEAVLIAGEALNRTNHAAAETGSQIEDPDTLSALFDDLSTARGLIRDATSIRNEEQEIEERSGRTQMRVPREAQPRIDQLHSDARSSVRSLGGTYPLLGFGPDEWAMSVASAQSTESLAQVLQGQIIELDESIEATRERLADDPDLVWQFDGLIAEVNAETGIMPGSDAAQAIADEKSEHEFERLVGDLALGALAITAGVVSGGTGTVAVLGAGVLVGTGAFQTWEEFRRYDIQNDANNVNMMSADPTIAWAVVALIGTAFDAAAVSAMLHELPQVTRAMRDVARGADEGTDVVEVLSQTMRTAGHADLTTQRQASVIAAARVQSEQRAAFDGLRAQINGGGRIVLEAGRESQITAEIAHSVHSALLGGIDGLDQWMRAPEALSLVGRVESLSPEEIVALRGAYRTARIQANRLQARAETLGLSEDEIRNALSGWARAPDTPADEVADNLESFASGGRGLDAPTPDGPGSPRRSDSSEADDTQPDFEFGDNTDIDFAPEGEFEEQTVPGRRLPDRRDGEGATPGPRRLYEPDPDWEPPEAAPPRGDPDAPRRDPLYQPDPDWELPEYQPPQRPGDPLVSDHTRERALELLPAESPNGTTARLPWDDEAECLRLYYAARQNTPEREVAIMRNSETGNYVLVQGDEGSVPWPTRQQLEERFGPDHPILADGNWEAQNWDVPFHTHPVEPGSDLTGILQRIPSIEDMNIARRRAVSEGQIIGMQVQVTTPNGLERVFINFDPNLEIFTFGGPVPPKSGTGRWTHEVRFFSTAEEYRDWAYPLYGSAAESPPPSL